MKKQIVTKFLSFVCGLFLCVGTLQARVGESKSELEQRLLQRNGKGLEVRGDDLIGFYGGQSPVRGWVEPMEDEVEFVIYLKINDDVIPTSSRLWESKGNRDRSPVKRPRGWLLYVVYYKGQSVLEYYLRSQRISPFEQRGILSLHGEWEKWKQGKLPDSEEFLQMEILPVNRYLEDASLYAALGGDSILIYDPRLDSLIAERIKAAQQEEAPDSLEGF